MKKILPVMLLCVPTLANAYDIYTENNGTLKIPHVNVGAVTYKVEMKNQGNFIFKVALLEVTNSVSTPSDTFDFSTGILNIPDVSFGTQNYKVRMVHQGDLVFNLLLAEPINTTLNKFSTKVLAAGLGFPYELIYGPDDHLWVTERVGLVSNINPLNGQKKILLNISSEISLSSRQDGLLGMALHPNLLKNTGEDYVYIAYTYTDDKLKIVKYNYDRNTQQLVSPVVLISNLPASNDHNAGRLVFGHDHKLYYSIGDLGANQFADKCNEIKSQKLPTLSEVNRSDWNSYQGKVLRLNLDGSIPVDNPSINGVKSHIYSYGFRNPQGLVFANNILYSTEHGPKTDDEINIISAGKNYGWPHLAGYQDNRGYEYCNWSKAANCSSLTFSNYTCPTNTQNQSESSWNGLNTIAPLKTMYTVDFGFNFQNPANCTNPFICWPSIAPSSVDHYNPRITSIPGWNNSLLMTSLKKGTIYRVKIDTDGSVLSDMTSAVYTQNRYRDIAIHPRERKFFVVTDAVGETTSPSGSNTGVLVNPGAVLEFTYMD